MERLELKLVALSVGDARLARVDAAGITGWCVWPDAPGVGAVVDVELSVQRAASWADVEVGSPTGARDPGPVAGLVVRAVVMDVDEQAVATLRLPGGAILLVDTVGEPPLHVLGRTVTLHLDHVLARPTNV